MCGVRGVVTGDTWSTCGSGFPGRLRAPLGVAMCVTCPVRVGKRLGERHDRRTGVPMTLAVYHIILDLSAVN